MATFHINTTEQEQKEVLDVLKNLQGKTVPVSKIADLAGMNQNRVRYVLIDLIDANKIKKVATKAFNAHYVRYKYDIV